MKNEPIVLTPDEAAELASLDAKAVCARKRADDMSALASAAWTKTKSWWDKLQACAGDSERLEIRSKYLVARQASDFANHARDRAEQAARKAEDHRVVRRYVDDWSAMENPNFFYRRIAAKRESVSRDANGTVTVGEIPPAA